MTEDIEPNIPASPSFPNAKSSPSPKLREKVKCTVVQRGLVGLANDTKWDEFLAAMRPRAAGRQRWRFSWRSKWVEGYISEWDCEWFYHLPFPLIGVEWLDVFFLEETLDSPNARQATVIDHSA